MIQVSHLSKRYGDFTAVDDLSFTIEDGHVYGLLGPNGAGKSTTMNIMTGCLSPTEGTVHIGGFDILEEPLRAKRLIGYLPELPPLYLEETPAEYLHFVGAAKGLRGEELRRQIESAVERTGLLPVQDRLIGTLSKGYRQRVGIAQALLGDPQVIILDEPTVGLDPLQIIEIRELIGSLGENHTVILSSHILSEVQAICEKVLILSRGKLVAFDTPASLEKRLRAEQSASFRVRIPPETAEAILAQVSGLAEWHAEAGEDGVLSVEARFQEDADAESVCGALTLAFAAQSFPILELRRQKASLEDVFLELTEQDAPPEEKESHEEEGDENA